MLSQINLSSVITRLDWIIFTLVLLLTLSSVFYGEYLKRKTVHSEKETFLDLLIMGRKLTLPMFIGTLVATWYGGIFGVTKIAFNNGIYNFITQGLFWYISYLVFAFFMVDKIDKYEAITLPDLIKKMFGEKSSLLAGVFNFFNVLPIAYTISIGLFSQMIFGGPLWLNMSAGVALVIMYSYIGGIRAVIFSDLIQFFVMCFGVLIVLIISIYKFGGLSFLKSSLPDSYFSPTGTQGLSLTLVWGLIAFSTLVDPNFYQRCFAAKDKKVAKKGIIISTFIWFCFDICTTFGAMYAKSVIPDANPSDAYLTYSAQLLPSGLRGLFLAGILATILSTLDSYLFLAGTTLSYDLAPKKFKGKVWFHHLGIILVGLISLLMSFIFEGNIKEVWKTLGSYSAGCLLIPVVLGHLFPKKIRDYQFCASCLTGVIGISVWRSIERSGFWANIDDLYIGVICSILGLLISRVFYLKSEPT